MVCGGCGSGVMSGSGRRGVVLVDDRVLFQAVEVVLRLDYWPEVTTWLFRGGLLFAVRDLFNGPGLDWEVGDVFLVGHQCGVAFPLDWFSGGRVGVQGGLW